VAKVKKDEIVLGADAFVHLSPQYFPEMRPVGGYDNKQKPPLYVTIIGSILMAVALPAAAIWGSTLPQMEKVKSFTSSKMAELKASWASISIPPAKVLIKEESRRSEKACEDGVLSKLCADLKIQRAVKADERRSWASKK